MDTTYLVKYNGSVKPMEKAKMIVDWLKLPAKKRPSLISMYMPEVDQAGHSSGPDSKDVKNAIALVDEAIGHFVSEIDRLRLDKDVDIIIVSDHGMSVASEERSINYADFVSPEEAWIIDHRPMVQVYPYKEQGLRFAPI